MLAGPLSLKWQIVPMSLMMLPALAAAWVVAALKRLVGAATQPDDALIYDMRGRICIVTGSNNGVGRSTALGLAKMGAHVIMACRNTQKAATVKAGLERALQRARHMHPFSSEGSFEVMSLDLRSLESVKSFATEIVTRCPDGVDVLVANAGLNTPLPGQEASEEGLETVFQVNYLSHFALALLLLPVMEKRARAVGRPGRLVTLGSVSHHWGAAPLVRRYAADLDRDNYATSKLAMIMFALEFNRRLANQHDTDVATKEVGGNDKARSPLVQAVSVNPGAVKTGIFYFIRPQFLWNAVMGVCGFLSCEEGAVTSIVAAAAPDRGDDGYIVPYSLWGGWSVPFEILSPFAGAVKSAPRLPRGEEALSKAMWDDSIALLAEKNVQLPSI